MTDELVFNTPNHEKELAEAKIILDKMGIRVDRDRLPLMSDEQKLQNLMITTKVLFKVGKLSEKVSSLRVSIEEAYFKQYRESNMSKSKVADKMNDYLWKDKWLAHYNRLGKPYDVLKNKSFKIIQLLDPLDEGVDDIESLMSMFTD